MVEEGQKVVIKGVFQGFPEPNVLWLHNKKPVRPSHDVKIEVGSKETSISFTKVFTYLFFFIIGILIKDPSQYNCKKDSRRSKIFGTLIFTD